MWTLFTLAVFLDCFFFNIFQTRSMCSSERAVLRLPEFSLFLFRLVPSERYFLTFCWIVLWQGGAWLNRYRNDAWIFRNIFLQQKLVLLLIIEALQPWISSRQGSSECFLSILSPDPSNYDPWNSWLVANSLTILLIKQLFWVISN